MALVTSNSGSGSGTSISVSNIANSVSVLFVTYYGNGAFANTSSITDPSGDTWTLRKRTRFQSAWLGAGTSANDNFITQECWWSNEVSAHNRTLTLNTVIVGGTIGKTQWVYQAVTGSLTPSAPWDTNASLIPAVQTFGNAGTTTAAITKGATTSQANSLVLAILSEVTSTSASTDSSTGAGFTAVNNQDDGTSPNVFHMFLEKLQQTTAGAFTAACTNNKQSFVFSVDALSGTATGSSAGINESTITTTLTKASQSASGTAGAGTTTGTITTTLTKASISVAAKETFTGTIATHLTKASIVSTSAVQKFIGTAVTQLTKPSQSLAAKEVFTGTVATHLTKASQSAAGTETLPGTISIALSKTTIAALATEVRFIASITTNLTKASMSAVAAEVFTGTANTALARASTNVTAAMEAFGTISTVLSKAHMSAAAVENFSGAIATHLSGISQTLRQLTIAGTITTTLRAAAQRIDASEIIVGSAVTNIDMGAAMAMEADTFEIFKGTINTNLRPINLSVVALEEIIGQATTRLGGEAGNVIANVVQATVIIEGPIVMSLAGVRPLILGVQLGTPGQAKWFSWRYTDA